jgi:pyridoxamine 5'-phosphate oxidase
MTGEFARMSQSSLQARKQVPGALLEGEAHPDPLEQFRRWLKEAMAADFVEPSAMVLATADRNGKPSARMVLLKNADERGFVFFTNYESRKAYDLLNNPRASLLFYWDVLGRQVRIEGNVERTSKEESEQYFKTRPFDSRIAAVISRQSSVVSSRAVLVEQFVELEEKYRGREVPLPPHWGGYRVVPEEFEFWQGRESRLHDRLRYTKRASGWHIERLSP